MSSNEILRVRKDDPEYQRMLREEAEFWDQRAITLASLPRRPSVMQYMNRRLTGDPDKDWYETIPDYGNFKKACIIGAEPGHIESFLLERLPDAHLSFYDISGESLARLRERLESSHPGRTSFHETDVNFIELPENAHDLVIANECVHHLVNLEHVASEINKTLTPDGRFFMFEVVAESYFQYTEEKKRLFEAYARATHPDPANAPEPRWPDRSNWTHSPFEAVRSGDIIAVFDARLDLITRRTLGAMLILTLFWPPDTDQYRGWNKPKSPARRLSDALGIGRKGQLDPARRDASEELLFQLDAFVEDSGGLKPGLAFAIYKKRQSM
jgi:SAM-dependent methyltransferase